MIHACFEPESRTNAHLEDLCAMYLNCRVQGAFTNHVATKGGRGSKISENCLKVAMKGGMSVLMSVLVSVPVSVPVSVSVSVLVSVPVSHYKRFSSWATRIPLMWEAFLASYFICLLNQASVADW